jgi:hypothetical protein
MAQVSASVDNVSHLHTGSAQGSSDAFVVPQSANINASASGNNTIVAAVGGKKIKVLQYKVVVSANVTVTWESSGGSVLDGPCAFAANGGEAPPYCPVGHFDTLTGEGLVMNLSSAVQVGGHLKYVLV